MIFSQTAARRMPATTKGMSQTSWRDAKPRQVAVTASRNAALFSLSLVNTGLPAAPNAAM